MHHGAVMEGSWGSESTMVADADAALALLRAELQAGDVVLVKASNAAGLGALADALVAEDVSADEADPHRRRHRADGLDSSHAGADPAVHPAGVRARDPRGRAAEPPQEARHPVDGRRRDRRRHLGRIPRHPADRHRHGRQGAVGVGLAGARAGHRAGRRRFRRRPDQDPARAQSGPEQDRQDGRHADRSGALRRAGAAVPQRRRADTGQCRAVLCAGDRHGHPRTCGVRAVLRA